MCGAEVALAATLLGTGISAYGSYQQGQASAKAAKANAEVSEQNAALAEQEAESARYKGEQEERAQRRKTALALGAQKAGYGASGVALEENSSAFDVLSDTAETGELDAMTIKHNTDDAVWAYRAQATNYRNQASLYRSQASSASTSGAIGSIGTLLTGTGSALGAYYYPKMSKT